MVQRQDRPGFHGDNLSALTIKWHKAYRCSYVLVTIHNFSQGYHHSKMQWHPLIPVCLSLLCSIPNFSKHSFNFVGLPYLLYTQRLVAAYRPVLLKFVFTRFHCRLSPGHFKCYGNIVLIVTLRQCCPLIEATLLFLGMGTCGMCQLM